MAYVVTVSGFDELGTNSAEGAINFVRGKYDASDFCSIDVNKPMAELVSKLDAEGAINFVIDYCVDVEIKKVK